MAQWLLYKLDFKEGRIGVKNFSQKYSLDRIFPLIAIFISILAMFINIFFGFDVHHDGLSLSTLILTKEALLGSGPYPFNQYGPAWTIPYLPISLLIPIESFYLAARLFTFVVYLATGIVLYNLAQHLTGTSRHVPLLTVLIFACSHPFYNDLGSSFVVWPSSINMFLMAFISLRVIKAFEEPRNNLNLIFIGILCAFIFLIRIQIGVLLFLILMLIFFFRTRYQETLPFAIAFTSTLSSFFIFLFIKGWFGSYWTDSILFPFTYISGDTSTYPRPYFTIIISTFFVGLFIVLNIINIKRRQIFALIFVGVATITISMLFLLNTRDLDLLYLTIILQRRFIVSFFISSFVFYSFLYLLRNKSGLRYRISQDHEFAKTIALIAISGVGLIQTWPLFDQMHAWWAFSPGFVLAAITCVSLAKNISLIPRLPSYLVRCITFILLIPLILGSVKLMGKNYSLDHSYIMRLISVPEIQAGEMRALGEFLNRTVPHESKILNLCENSDVFLQEARFFSQTGYFIFWASMSRFGSITDSLQTTSDFDFVLTCSMNQVPKLRTQNSLVMNEVFSQVLKRNPKLELVGSISSQGRIWKIYNK